MEQVVQQCQGKRIFILSPVSLGHGQEIEANVKTFIKNGYYRVWKKGEILDLTALPISSLQDQETTFILVDRLIADDNNRARLSEAIQRGFQLGNGRVEVAREDAERLFL